jgi:hypothetical protein
VPQEKRGDVHDYLLVTGNLRSVHDAQLDPGDLWSVHDRQSNENPNECAP